MHLWEAASGGTLNGHSQERRPPLSRTFGSAPSSRSAWTMSRRPRQTAKNRAVIPRDRLRRSTSPRFRRAKRRRMSVMSLRSSMASHKPRIQERPAGSSGLTSPLAGTAANCKQARQKPSTHQKGTPRCARHLIQAARPESGGPPELPPARQGQLPPAPSAVSRLLWPWPCLGAEPRRLWRLASRQAALFLWLAAGCLNRSARGVAAQRRSRRGLPRQELGARHYAIPLGGINLARLSNSVATFSILLDFPILSILQLYPRLCVFIPLSAFPPGGSLLVSSVHLRFPTGFCDSPNINVLHTFIVILRFLVFLDMIALCMCFGECHTYHAF